MDAFDTAQEALPSPAASLAGAKTFTWKGAELAAYSFARRAVWLALAAPGEDPVKELFTVGLLHVLLAPKETVREWLFNPKAARESVIEAMDTFLPAYYPDAVKLANEVLDHHKNLVEAEPSAPGMPQKKT